MAGAQRRVTMETVTERTRTRQRAVALAGWLPVVALLLGTFAAGVPVRFRHLINPVLGDTPALMAGLPPAMEAAFTGRLGPGELSALQGLGLSPGVYATYLVAWDIALVVAGLVVGTLIFWRRPDDWLTLWVSLILVLLGTNGISPMVPTLAAVWPYALEVSVGAGLLGMISNVHILFLSPDGRAVPRWTLKVAAGFTGGLLAVGGYTFSPVGPWGMMTGVGLMATVFLPVWLAVLGLGLWSQVYRYRHVSGAVQRQQTKWVALGLGAVVLGFVVNALFLWALSQQAGLARVLTTLARAPITNGLMALLPVCVGVSIWRYRLWDIDVIVRRTLIYSSLTAALVGVYLGSVVVLQAMFQAVTGERQPQFVTVLSTLAIAALFGPLRGRVQDFIDRRFFRRKYDAAKIIAAFSASVRDETDLDRLAERLVSVVEETMQPRPVGLWLRGAGGRMKDEGGRRKADPAWCAGQADGGDRRRTTDERRKTTDDPLHSRGQADDGC